MPKTVARELYDISTTHSILYGLCQRKYVVVRKSKDRSIYIFKDNSTTELDNFGNIKIDGRFVDRRLYK